MIRRMAGVISVLSSKGGAAKTTSAVHIIGRLRERFPDAPLMGIDSDPQEHLTRWLGEAADDVHVERVTDAEELLTRVPVWGSEMDMRTDHPPDQRSRLVIDVAGGDSELLRSAALRSDLVVVPCAPSLMDLSSAGETFGAIQLVRDILDADRPVMMFLPVRMTKTRIAAEVLESLREFDEIVVEPGIGQRVVVADAFGAGKFCWDMPDAADVGEAMRAAADFIIDEVTPRPYPD